MHGNCIGHGAVAHGNNRCCQRHKRHIQPVPRKRNRTRGLFDPFANGRNMLLRLRSPAASALETLDLRAVAQDEPVTDHHQGKRGDNHYRQGRFRIPHQA